MSWWLRCCIHTERFLLCMQSTRPAAVICLEAAVRTEKKQKKKQKTNKKQRQRQTVKFNIKTTNIFFQLNTYFVFLSTYLYSLPVPDFFNKQRLIFLHKLFRHFAAGALLNVCSYRIAAFPSFKEFVSQKQSSRIFECDGILSFSRGLHN